MFKLSPKPKERSSALESKPIDTVIGSEVVIEGNIIAKNAIKIDGQVQGDIKSGGVVLGQKAEIKGNVESTNLVIYGKVLGNINCKDLILKSSGEIFGDIHTTAIEIEHGGKYNGKLAMNNQQAVSEPSKS